MNKLLLIDGNSILNRAFYGLPDLTTKDGLHTNAVLGFLNIILKVIDEEKATHICVAFDVNTQLLDMRCLVSIREQENLCQMSLENKCLL